MTNDLSSPLAQAVRQQEVEDLKALLPLQAEPESTPSTRTYLHTLAIGQLAALCLAQAELAPHLAALQVTADGIAAYLQDWQAQMQRLGEALDRAPGIAVDRPGWAGFVADFCSVRRVELARSRQAARPRFAGG